MWRSLVAHLTGGQGVAGSNPVHPTSKTAGHGLTARGLFSLVAMFSVLGGCFGGTGGPGKSVHFDTRGRGYRAIRGPLRGKLSVQLPPSRVDVLLSDLGRSGWLLISETRVAMSSNLRCSQAIALKPKYCHK